MIFWEGLLCGAFWKRCVPALPGVRLILARSGKSSARLLASREILALNGSLLPC